MSNKMRYGACIYCGQIGTYDGDGEFSDKNIDILVSKECNCDSAVKKRNGELTISRAEAQISQLRENYSYGITELIKIGARLVQTGEADKVQVTAENGDKLSVSVASKGIKVSRIRTKKEEATV